MSEAPLPEPADQLRFEDEQLDAPMESTEREVRVSGAAPAGTHEASETHHIDREDPLMDAFFRHPDKPVIDVWEETHPPRAMSRGSRRAMYASIGIFAVSVTVIGGFAAYHTLVMPAPVELGASAGEETAAVLPTPLAAAPVAEYKAPAPAPAAAAPIAPVAPAMPAAPAQTETQLSAASNPPAEEPAAPTVAALAAREPPPEPRATGAADGVAAAHLRGVVAAEPSTVEQPADRAPAVAVAEAEAQTQDPMPPMRQGAHGASPPTYDELVAIGRALTKKNRRVEASEAFRRALLHAPDGSAALSGLSFVYLNAEQNLEAREYAQRAVRADATNAEGWIVLGAALELLGDKPGAQAAYHSCVEQGRGPYLSQCKQVARP
ncbi:MAG TPA: hypothetical protein VJV78_15535 [Polyangiales bacterium]|nr:hypothetical protein [Polyangiales bacterium]